MQATDGISKTSTASAIWRDGQCGYVDAASEHLLRRALQTRACRCHQDPDGTLVVHRRRHALYTREPYMDEPALKFGAGLLPAVYAALCQAGVSVSFRGGMHRAKLPLPAWGKELPDRPLLEHVADHDRGLIRFNAETIRPLVLVEQVARAWPDLNITVIASRRDDVINYAKDLRAKKIDAFGFTARNQPDVSARVAVCTFAGLAYNPIEIEKQNIIIVLDAVEAVGENQRWCLEHAINARLYGFLDLAQSLSPHEEDLVRSLFGFEETLIPWSGNRSRPIEVAWMRGEGRRLQKEPANDLELKRYGVWHNDSRNRQIARVARAFVTGGLKALTGLLLSDSPLPSWPAPPNTFIVVENVEHALALLPKLPGWSVMAAGLVNLDGLSAQQQAAIEYPTSFFAAAPYGIVTHGGMRHSQIP